MSKIFQHGTDTFNFGKHRGQAIADVIRDDPEYVDWCREEIEGFWLSSKLEQQLDGTLQKIEDDNEPYLEYYDTLADN